jgi:hypothetical protein
MHLRQENQKIRDICKGVLKALGGWVRQSGVLVSPLAGWLAGWLVGWLAGWLAARPVCLPACQPACLHACKLACLAGWPASRPLAPCPHLDATQSCPRVELGRTTRSTCNRSTVRDSGHTQLERVHEWDAVGRCHTAVDACGRTHWLDKSH